MIICWQGRIIPIGEVGRPPQLPAWAACVQPTGGEEEKCWRVALLSVDAAEEERNKGLKSTATLMGSGPDCISISISLLHLMLLL